MGGKFGHIGQTPNYNKKQISKTKGMHNSDWSLSQDVGRLVFDRFPRVFTFYVINETHKQYSLLNTRFADLLFGPSGKYLPLSIKEQLHVCWLRVGFD